MGDRSIFYNFIETPVLAPQPAPAPSASGTASNNFELVTDWKPELFLFFSATVHDRSVTEIRWQREEGEYVIWSSIDFNLLRSTS